jgi:hypothetical protein
MKSGVILTVLSVTALVVAAELAHGGHEAAVYPSYYPHEITIETALPDRAAGLLRENKIQAWLGAGQVFGDTRPADIRSVESLGDFVMVRVNPHSQLTKDTERMCAAVAIVINGMAGRIGFTLHPYPVTPLHGDYLNHVDRAEAALARMRQAPAALPAGVTLKEQGRPDWDLAIEAIDAAGLVASAQTSMDGWLGPPWLKTGWFQAAQLLDDAITSDEAKERAATLSARLEVGEYADAVERINLERELVALLAGSCHHSVAGYTVKRQFFSADFTNGVENIGFDAIIGLNSPIFLRTVKLKDFPWNGWLALGIDDQPASAWNPIAGFNDEFGRFLWAAIGDPALLPAPYDSGWMLNRIADVQTKRGR